MNKKLAIALIALVGIGLYALPQTMALFAGQHSFVNIDPTGNQINCVKCHGDVQAELSSNFNEMTNTSAPHASMACEYCHRLQIGQSSGDNAYYLVEYQGVAQKIADPANSTTVRRYLVMKLSDFEARLYPNTVTYNATEEKADGRIITMANATSTAKFNPLFDTANLNYSATVWAWNDSTAVKPRARQTDVIVNGVGTVQWYARYEIYPTYEDVDGKSLKDTLFTKDEAFTPSKVNFVNQSSATAQPIVLLDGAGSKTVNAGSRYHAASLVSCMDCHAGASPQPGHERARLGQTTPDDEIFCKNCHYGTEEAAVNINGTNVSHLRTYELSAGGFGLGLTNNNPDTGDAEVHKALVKAQDSISVYGGRMAPASNDACIACHTHVDVDISYTRPTTLTFIADRTTGNWSLDDFSSTGTNTTTG